MPLIQYQQFNFKPERLALIERAVEIIDDYRAQGYSLTLRQLYYQFVSRDAFPQTWADPATGSTNNERSYDRLGTLISDARMAGMIDWEAIEDRTRNVDGNPHWESPQSMIEACSTQFRLDKWDSQRNRVEVWVEKDALEGVVGQTARALDIQFFSCRGYSSMTSLWEAGQRLKTYAQRGQTPVIIHLGDHDPSGIDMSRDIEDRVSTFMDEEHLTLRFQRLGLNRAQVRQYNPPPNPAKVTDSRYAAYRREHGEQCWELDALEPAVIDDLIRDAVAEYRDDEAFAAAEEQERQYRRDLTTVANGWAKALRAATPRRRT